MIEGEISLESTVADVLTDGGGFAELRFHEPQEQPTTILTHSNRKPGLGCKDCGHFLIIGDLEYTSSECLVCHSAMDAGVTTCPKCGWSYIT
jgi:hypothetical protein